MGGTNHPGMSAEGQKSGPSDEYQGQISSIQQIFADFDHNGRKANEKPSTRLDGKSTMRCIRYRSAYTLPNILMRKENTHIHINYKY